MSQISNLAMDSQLVYIQFWMLFLFNNKKFPPSHVGFKSLRAPAVHPQLLAPSLRDCAIHLTICPCFYLSVQISIIHSCNCIMYVYACVYIYIYKDMFDLSYVPIHIVARVLIHLYTFNQFYWMTKTNTPPRPKKTATNPFAMCKS